MNIYFSDFFKVPPEKLEEHGAFNISLINDLPLFIDPFLLFNSPKPEYQALHHEIIKYVSFLRDMAETKNLSPGLIKSWFHFPEVKENWFGYSTIGNNGSGLAGKFAASLYSNLNTIFQNFGSEEITTSSHLEKLCLIKDGVGKDNISDFTTNLIKGYLLRYTQEFSKENISPKFLRTHAVSHTQFNYQTRSWITEHYLLPTLGKQFILLTPKDILTKDDTWINKNDMVTNFTGISSSIPNEQLRAQLNEYLARSIPKEATQKEINSAITATIRKFPEYIDYFIKHKEDNGDGAVKLSDIKVRETETIFIRNVKKLVEQLSSTGDFYKTPKDSFEETLSRVLFLKSVIENNDGYRIFYVNGEPLKREQDLQLLFKLTWHASDYDVNAEVNNGRGPVDYKISKGSQDKTLVEFKLASNSKLKQNLQNQVKIYEAANNTTNSIKVVLYFSDTELERITKILKELKISTGKSLILIDARPGKTSASNVRDLFSN